MSLGWALTKQGMKRGPTADAGLVTAEGKRTPSRPSRRGHGPGHGLEEETQEPWVVQDTLEAFRRSHRLSLDSGSFCPFAGTFQSCAPAVQELSVHCGEPFEEVDSGGSNSHSGGSSVWSPTCIPPAAPKGRAPEAGAWTPRTVIRGMTTRAQGASACRLLPGCSVHSVSAGSLSRMSPLWSLHSRQQKCFSGSGLSPLSR